MLRHTLRAIQRAVLGKSSGTYLEQLTGSDEYWNRVVAAQVGWPQQSAPGVDQVARVKQGAGPVTDIQN